MKHKKIEYYTCDRCGRKYILKTPGISVSNADLCGPCQAALEAWFFQFNKGYQKSKEFMGWNPEEEDMIKE